MDTKLKSGDIVYAPSGPGNMVKVGVFSGYRQQANNPDLVFVRIKQSIKVCPKLSRSLRSILQEETLYLPHTKKATLSMVLAWWSLRKVKV